MGKILKSNNWVLWSAFGGLLIAVCVLAIVRAWPLLFPDAAISVAADPACDLRSGPCAAEVAPAGRVSLSIEPRGIPVMQPLGLRVEIRGIDARSVKVDFSGIDMNMGFNRIALERKEEGVYTGSGILPVCIRDAMEWEANVMIDTPQGPISVAYRFMTVRPGAR